MWGMRCGGTGPTAAPGRASRPWPICAPRPAASLTCAWWRCSSARSKSTNLPRALPNQHARGRLAVRHQRHGAQRQPVSAELVKAFEIGPDPVGEQAAAQVMGHAALGLIYLIRAEIGHVAADR